MAENTNHLNPATNNFLRDNNFLYKAIFVSLLVLVISLFIPASTQDAPPDYINKTTSWEVVQLVLVGIAVSYGLFSSKRNDQPKTQDKEEEHDQHAPLSYMSRLLQVSSSVFDDDDDDEKQMVENNSKVVERTWNSQYHRGEPPIVVVAKESSSAVDDANTTIEKLCLPPSVGRGRSLKPSPSNNNNNNNSKEGDNYYYYRKSLSSVSGSSSSFSTGTGKRRFSRNLTCPKEEESKEEDNIVLRSPVPWRSRSGRMQLREEEKEEIQSKSPHEDVGVRKTMYPQSSPAPPPPPPPPPPPLPPHRLVLLNNNKIKINTSTRYAPHNQDSQNRARQGGRLVEDVTPTHKYHRSLSHDKEIERFIKTRGGSRKNNKMDDEANDDDDDDADTQTQSFTENPKKQQRQASASTRIKDSDQSSSSSTSEDEEDDDDDELQELASTKNNEAMNEEEMMSGSDHNVDKKADEFIAKFREQIRLQRIASIRTTATTQAITKTGPPTR